MAFCHCSCRDGQNHCAKIGGSLFLILFLRISGAVSLGYAMSMGLLSTFPSQGELARYLPFKQ
jgi:hypothetical protein